MPAHARTRPLITAFALLAATSVGAAPFVENTVPGKLTTTEDEALYGVAIMRAAPTMESAAVGKLIPGSKVTVFPETSPESWWYIEMESEAGVSHGFVPRSFVKMNQGPFKDVEGDHWAAGALARLKATGDLTGYDGGYFQGERPFTRFEMAVLLDRYMGRLKTARERIEDQIAKIPMQANLGGHDARSLDEVIQKLESLTKEEGELRGMLGKVQAQVDVHQQRLDAMHDEFASVVHHDKVQDQRLDELARSATKLSAEVAAVRAMGKTYAQAETAGNGGGEKLTSTLAANIVRVKELMQRAENLEAKVASLESRDRLARLLRKEETTKAEAAPVLAIREGSLPSSQGQM